jgi:hypothetical protein
LREGIEKRAIASDRMIFLLVAALLFAVLYVYPGDMSPSQRVALAALLMIPAFILASILKDLMMRN